MKTIPNETFFSVVFAAIFIVIISLPLSAVQPEQSNASSVEDAIKYYRVDTVKTINGKIESIANEKSYHKHDFVVIYLKEKKSGEKYRVEVAPRWYFDVDLMVGSMIEVTGSDCGATGPHVLMTRSITFQGEHYLFRDDMGFPLWRGGKKHGGQGSGSRQQRRRGNKGRGGR